MVNNSIFLAAVVIVYVFLLRIDTAVPSLIPLGFQHRTIGDDIGRVICECDAVLHTSVFPSIYPSTVILLFAAAPSLQTLLSTKYKYVQKST